MEVGGWSISISISVSMSEPVGAGVEEVGQLGVL